MQYEPLILALLIISAYTDIKQRQVKNILILPGIVAGLVYTLSLGDPREVIVRISFIVFLFFFGMLCLMKPAEIKLCMMLTLFEGVMGALQVTGIAYFIAVAHYFLKTPDRPSWMLKRTARASFDSKKLVSVSKVKIPMLPYFLAAYIIFAVINFLR